jgi:hypothetical protein
MAAITFHINNFGAASSMSDPTLISHGVGSGLGFYGGGFGISVPVAQYQDTTYVTNANGTASGIRGNNTKYTSASGLSFNGATTIGSSGAPNYYAPLRVRFNHSEAVRVQNCKLRVFDRNDISRQASGVTTQVYEVRHPHPTEGESATYGPLDHRGIATHGWYEYDPVDSMTDMDLTASPGVSGLNTVAGETLPSGDGTYHNWITNEGAAHQSVDHDWYLALSASPDSIGSKTDYGLYMTLEYL